MASIMARNILAPWAEPVPDAPYPMTVAQMQALPDDNWQYELVDGRLVRVTGSGSKASAIAINLAAALLAFVKAHKLGRVSGADGAFNLTRPGASTETALVPDVAYVSAGRLAPLCSDAANAIPHLAPDLLAEVAPPSQYRPEMAEKARKYLETGVRLVWVIWPDDVQVDVWRQGAGAPVATLTLSDHLDGLDVLSGFTHPVADLFTE